MPSASDRLFAIPELVSKILQACTWRHDDEHHATWISLLRISPIFHILVSPFIYENVVLDGDAHDDVLIGLEAGNRTSGNALLRDAFERKSRQLSYARRLTVNWHAGCSHWDFSGVDWSSVSVLRWRYAPGKRPCSESMHLDNVLKRGLKVKAETWPSIKVGRERKESLANLSWEGAYCPILLVKGLSPESLFSSMEASCWVFLTMWNNPAFWRNVRRWANCETSKEDFLTNHEMEIAEDADEEAVTEYAGQLLKTEAYKQVWFWSPEIVRDKFNSLDGWTNEDLIEPNHQEPEVTSVWCQVHDFFIRLVRGFRGDPQDVVGQYPYDGEAESEGSASEISWFNALSDVPSSVD